MRIFFVGLAALAAVVILQQSNVHDVVAPALEQAWDAARAAASLEAADAETSKPAAAEGSASERAPAAQ